jgi:hypothetical protein
MISLLYSLTHPTHVGKNMLPGTIKTLKSFPRFNSLKQPHPKAVRFFYAHIYKTNCYILSSIYLTELVEGLVFMSLNIQMSSIDRSICVLCSSVQPQRHTIKYTSVHGGCAFPRTETAMPGKVAC